MLDCIKPPLWEEISRVIIESPRDQEANHA